MKEWIQMARRGQRWLKPRYGSALLLHPDPTYAQMEAALLLANNGAGRIEICSGIAEAQAYLLEALGGRRTIPELIIIHHPAHLQEEVLRTWKFLKRMLPDCRWEEHGLPAR